MRKTAKWAAVTGAVLLLGMAALVRGALEAERELQAARERLAAVSSAVADGDLERARSELAALQSHAAAAQDATDGPLWAVASAAPWAGRTPATLRRVTGTVGELAAEVLPDLLVAADQLAPSRLLAGADRVNLDALTATAPVLRRAQIRLAPLVVEQPSGRAGVLPVVSAAEQELAAELGRLERSITHAADAARLLPDVLGANGPRRYFLALQTPAEARGTGGMLGGYGILVADRGRLTLPVLSDHRTLQDVVRTRVRLDPEYQALYGRDPELWSGANLSPHFPYAAELWLDMWAQQSGEQLDGALATDPGGLAHLLRATGPVRLEGGEEVSADNVVVLTGRDAYARFGERADDRKDYLVGIARAVVGELLSDRSDPRELLTGLSRAATEGRLLAYSTRSQEQHALEGTRLAGELPDEAGPYAAVVVNNAAGNKLDYYLSRSVEYVLGPCQDDRRPSTVRVRLTNTAPAGGLPAYVTGRADLPVGATWQPGATKLHVALYASKGAALRRAVTDGRRVAVRLGQEREHPVFLLTLELAPGQTREVVFDLVEPAVAAAPRVPEQPLVLPQHTEVVDAECPVSDDVSVEAAARSSSGQPVHHHGGQP